MSTSSHYQTPRIVKVKQGWYIMYSYKIPVQVRHIYGNKTWYRSRITKDMNRMKAKEREDFANWLMAEITGSLKNGHNQFSPEIENVEQLEDKLPDLVTAEKAFNVFLDA